MRTVLVFVVSLLVISSGILVAFNGGVAAAPPEGIEDRATSTVSTGGIYPHLLEGGQICATKLEEDVNRVVVTNATVKDVDIYLGDENGGVTSHMSVPSGEVNGEMIIYTNGENVLIDTMARLGICLPPGVPNPLPITLEAYYIGTQNLKADNVQLKSGGNPPEASGPTLKQVMKETNTSRSDIGLNNSTNLTDGTVNNSSTPANNTTVPENNTTTPNNQTENNRTQAKNSSIQANNSNTPKNNNNTPTKSSTPTTTNTQPTTTTGSTPTKTTNVEQQSNEQTNTKEGPKTSTQTTTQTNTPTETPKATEPEKTENPTQTESNSTTTTTESDGGGGIIDGIIDFISPDDNEK